MGLTAQPSINSVLLDVPTGMPIYIQQTSGALDAAFLSNIENQGLHLKGHCRIVLGKTMGDLLNTMLLALNTGNAYMEVRRNLAYV